MIMKKNKSNFCSTFMHFGSRIKWKKTKVPIWLFS